MSSAVFTGAHPVEQHLILAPSADQVELQGIVRSFLAGVLPDRTADRPTWADVDPGRGIWKRMAAELGLQALAIDEEHGGQGFGLSELVLVFEELGRMVAPLPMLGSIALAARTLTHAPASSVREETLEALAAGELLATAALERTTITATGEGAAVTLSGTTPALVDGDTAEVVLVLADGAQGRSLYLVGADAAGVAREVVTGLDLTRGLARFTFAQSPATLVAGPDDCAEVVARGLAEAAILLSSESVGGARAALDETVEYSKVRVQYGRQIGSFQSLKHRMADILIATEAAWSSVRYAAGLADLRPLPDLVELELAASVAKAASSQAQLFAAAEDIQIHGGIGFTWEHPAHLRFRRAKSSEVLLGLPQDHHERIVALLGHQPAAASTTDSN